MLASGPRPGKESLMTSKNLALLPRLFLLPLLLLSLSALPAPRAEAAIDGLYGSDCLSLDGLSALTDLYFDEGSFELVQTVFRDDHCEEAAYDLSLRGRYSWQEASKEQIDFTFLSAHLTPLDQNAAKLFQLQALCGMRSWKAQTPLEVSGQRCGEQKIPAAGSQVFDRILIGFDGLQLGLADPEFNGSSPDRRPRSWAPIIYRSVDREL